MQCEGFAEKEDFKPGMKEWGGDGILIIISINVSSIQHNNRIKFNVIAMSSEDYRVTAAGNMKSKQTSM